MPAMTLHVHHLALRVADLERALAFYAGVLGLPEVQRLRHADGAWRSVWLRAGNAILMLETELKPRGATGGSAHVLAFVVDDLPRWEERLAAAGIEILDRTAHTLYVSDADGHRVGLSTLTLPA